MLAKKKKLTKKQIKEDKLVSFYSSVMDFYEEYQSKILIAGGIIAVIVVAIILYTNKIQKDNTIATTHLARIILTYEAGLYQEAIDGYSDKNIIGLKQIVEEYGSTEQGNYAKIFLANSYYYLGLFDQAFEYYNDYSGSNDLFKAAALAGKASCYETTKKYLNAGDNFKEAAFISENNASNPDYLLKAAINYIKVNEYTEANRLLDIILADYSSSTQKQEAERYLAVVKLESNIE